jgi:hypothetical protein
MDENRIAEELRAQVARLNGIMAEAARLGLRVELHSTLHQTAAGEAMPVLDATVYKRLAGPARGSGE